MLLPFRLVFVMRLRRSEVSPYASGSAECHQPPAVSARREQTGRRKTFIPGGILDVTSNMGLRVGRRQPLQYPALRCLSRESTGEQRVWPAGRTDGRADGRTASVIYQAGVGVGGG